MPRFGIPFLVVAILASCIAVNTVQFPRVRQMLHPNSQGGADESAAETEDSAADYDSEIPEPIAALDSPGPSAGFSPPESSAPMVMVAESSNSVEDRYAARYGSSPAVAEVARPVASEYADQPEEIGPEADFSPPKDDPPPMRSRGSWDTPSFSPDEEDETYEEETSIDPSVDSGASRYGLGGDVAEEATSLVDEGARSPGAYDQTIDVKEDQNIFIPAPSVEAAAKTEIDWPAEAAPSARYAQRSTTSSIAHAEVRETHSTPETPDTSAVASSKRLVPVRRPSAKSKQGTTPALTVSGERNTHSEDTAAFPQVERLPAVK